ncbi:MAG TPA: metallophosphoesterase family protein [Acidobacteriaceae bacterium]|jgi:diadenosine tetraphosphatase ApaH/serine/threonine PP2A family protein phosphatase
MRVLVVSDIHGNLQALEAVLSAAGTFDELWNLGDIVGYGANPNQVIDTVRPLARINVRGNHDRVCCGLTSSQGFNPVAAEAALWTQRHLTPENLDWLRAMPQGPIRATERALCAHGSPLNEDHYIISMRDAWTPLQRMPAEITFFGHTHVQGAFSQQAPEWQEVRPLYNTRDAAEQFSIDVPPGTRHLINPGSVGQPRDGDWRAGFAIYDTTDERVTFFRNPYDVASAQQAIRSAHLPERLAARLSTGR